jgi:hypothetical protein
MAIQFNPVLAFLGVVAISQIYPLNFQLQM